MSTEKVTARNYMHVANVHNEHMVGCVCSHCKAYAELQADLAAKRLAILSEQWFAPGDCNECWTEEDATDHAPECSQRIYVNCDENCGALMQPITLAETTATLIHYRSHAWLSGCSHGE